MKTTGAHRTGPPLSSFEVSYGGLIKLTKGPLGPFFQKPQNPGKPGFSTEADLTYLESYGAPYRATTRTYERLIRKLVERLRHSPAALDEFLGHRAS